MWNCYALIERHTPWANATMRTARQQRGEIGFAAINAVDVPVALTAMALLPVLMLVGFYSLEFADLGVLQRPSRLRYWATPPSAG